MNERRFAIRTVRDGTVKIGGKVFVPRTGDASWMDGRRFAFGRYWIGDKCEDFVCLWGTEKLFWAASAEDSDEEDSEYEREWTRWCNELCTTREKMGDLDVHGSPRCSEWWEVVE